MAVESALHHIAAFLSKELLRCLVARSPQETLSTLICATQKAEVGEAYRAILDLVFKCLFLAPPQQFGDAIQKSVGSSVSCPEQGELNGAHLYWLSPLYLPHQYFLHS